MYDYREPWKIKIARVINAMMEEAGAGSISPESVIAEIPPNPEMGDIGFPMFSYAKALRKGPPQIALAVRERLEAEGIAAGVEAQG
ncbi:MAG TPA: arginine--tRNA ligase, partial [Treponema sp.]|nr:arginine--tRNA ligase [Treponema sp.]